MRASLPLRIFVIHTVFTLGAGAVAVVFVLRAFEQYRNTWDKERKTLAAERIFQPLANEVGRSLLLRLERGVPEEQELVKERISQGLDSLLPMLPSIQSLLVLDLDHRIRYASDASAVDLGFTKPEDLAFFASPELDRRPFGKMGGITEVMVPVYEGPTPGDTTKRRLGSVLVRYRGDPEIEQRQPAFKLPSNAPKDFVLPLVAILALVAAGGSLLSALTSLPVRRLERALLEFRSRGFRGGIDTDQFGLGDNLASAVSAINEMGGKLAALDERGRERESLLATLSQSLEDGMIALDSQGVPRVWNPAAIRILAPVPRREGAAGEEQAPSVPEEQRLRDALARHAHALWAEAASADGTRIVDLAQEDGTWTSSQVTEIPFEMRPGETWGLLLIRDLAALQKVEAHLLEAGRFAVLAHLAAGLAHETRNALHSFGLNATVLEEYMSSPPTEERVKAMSESVATIREETRRLQDLLNGYLGLFPTTSSARSVDVRALCRHVVQLLSYEALKAHVEIVLEGGDDLPTVHGVPDRLQQAILNLVLNAIQAMPQPHGGVVRIQTSASAGLLRLTVLDNGPGLAPELAERLFDVRVTTKPTGTGLGLPLVRLIAEAHGGSIWYRSIPGEGASFTLVLPAEEAAAYG